MKDKSKLHTFIKKKHFVRQTGFTLIELLATLAILGVITGIAVPAVGNIREKAKQSAYDSSVALIEKASTMADVDGLDYSDGVYGVYTVQDLIDEGYLSDVSDETLLSGYTSRVAADMSTYVFNGDILDAPSSESTWQEWADRVIAESPEYVVAKDEDFIGDEDGKFIYNGTDEKVIVPEIIKGVPITSAKEMFSKDTPVVAVAMNNPNVKDMSYMFSYNPSTSLDVSNLVTENVDNMEGMFMESKATSLDVSSFDTSKVTNMYSMFHGSHAESLDLSSFDTSNVTDMTYMFLGSRATSLDVSSFDTSNVTNMSWMFYNSSATSLDVSSFDTSNVTNMSYMFAFSPATSINLSSFDTSKVTDMKLMFMNSRATSLYLSSFDTSNVKDMSSMFTGSQATILDLSSFDTFNVTNMSGMFGWSNVRSGYARTQTDADKFNNSSNKPSGLTFTVKP